MKTMKQVSREMKNPYPVNHPQWKHFGLGVLVEQGRLNEGRVISWSINSPAHKAFLEGREAGRVS
jgi:hypothetical protein